jgi:hypothetical protein
MSPVHVIGHPPNSWGTYHFLTSHVFLISPIGHIKPLIALFARIADRQPASAAVITLLSSAPMLSKIQRELELMPGHLAERIK